MLQAVLLLATTAAAALDPAKSVKQYVHSSWTSSDGLPENVVYAITQTRDGHLWFGTGEGLAKSMAGNSQFLIGEMCQDSKTVPSWPYWKTTNSRSCGWALILAALLATVQVSFVPSARATDFPTIM